MTGERVERRLAAILAADVVGYSRLVSADEADALARLGKLRRDIIEPNVASHSGRLFKIMGDGFLAEFASAVQAISCALAIQRETEATASGFDDAQKMRLRIGIHVGDVMVEGEDLMGDGINIAARLEGIAASGGISISRAVHDQVRDRIKITFDDKGDVALKNIVRPVQVFAVAGATSAVPVKATPSALALPDKPSIAVLPFQNMSGDREQEYFSDGIVEDIITALSRFKSLFVIARNSSFTYKGKPVDIKQVGRELGVRYVLEGSVRKALGKVRIAGQLIEAATGANLWADRFDGPLDDIFELQDKVASRVVAAIAPRLEFAEFERSKLKPTERLDAFDLYYHAIHSFRRANRQATEDALRFARQAISLDPNFAAAYGVALACYSHQKGQGWTKDDDGQIAEFKQYALRVAELGADDAFALTRAAHFYGHNLKEPRTADVIIEQALAVNPNLSEAWRIRGWTSLYLGQHEPALEQFQHAIRLNPLDVQIYMSEAGLAQASFFLHRFESALSWATKSLARQSNFATALRIAMISYARLGRIADAQMMQARLREADIDMTIAQFKKWMLFQRHEDVDLYIEALRLAGVSE